MCPVHFIFMYNSMYCMFTSRDRASLQKWNCKVARDYCHSKIKFHMKAAGAHKWNISGLNFVVFLSLSVFCLQKYCYLASTLW